MDIDGSPIVPPANETANLDRVESATQGATQQKKRKITISPEEKFSNLLRAADEPLLKKLKKNCLDREMGHRRDLALSSTTILTEMGFDIEGLKARMGAEVQSLSQVLLQHTTNSATLGRLTPEQKEELEEMAEAENPIIMAINRLKEESLLICTNGCSLQSDNE